MKIYTIESGKVSEGARIDSFTLKGAGVTIPTIIVGEKGRGRELGVLPVSLLPEQQKEWEEKGEVFITAAEIGQTRAGKPKLISRAIPTTNEEVIVVFRTRIGYRGSNSHAGDRKKVYYILDDFFRDTAVKAGIPLKDEYTEDEVLQYAPLLVKSENIWFNDFTNLSPTTGFDEILEFHPFPGRVIVKGVIAQGDAGRMGRGEQLVAVMPKGIVFRTGYTGRLYGASPSHYYIWTGEKLLSATWEEREVSDLF